MNLTAKTHPVMAIPPQAAGSALAGDYISMKKTDHITVAVQLENNATAASATTAITLYQAKAVAGTDAKVLAENVAIDLVDDAESSDILVGQTEDVDLTLDAVVSQKLAFFEVPVEKLDINNDFDCLQVRIGGSDALNMASAMYWCSGERYHNTTKIVD